MTATSKLLPRPELLDPGSPIVNATTTTTPTPVSPAPTTMKNEALEFATYLETQLVPDFREAGMTPTADDFATAARLLRSLAADLTVAALVAAARGILNGPAEGHVAMGEPDSFENRAKRLATALAPFASNVAPPVSPDTDDRRPVWSFEVDGKHTRWCGTLDQWHKDRIAYVDKSEGTWEAHGPHMRRFIEPGVNWAKPIKTIFRAVKNK